MNNYFTKEKKHHVNMVYHLEQLHKKYYPEKGVDVINYVNDMDVDNLYYALKQYYQFIQLN